MLHPQYLRKGARVDIPELSGHVAKGKPTFEVKGVFAGGMGICVHLCHIDTGAEYALKGVRPDLIESQSTADRFLDELRVWLSASSCNLVAEAVAVVRINEAPCVLAVWMPHGDLAYSLPRLGKREKFEILLRLVRALGWVRNNLGVIHRDLKPANVLLDRDDRGYVADWGLARPVGLAMQRVMDSEEGQAVDRPDRTQAGSFLGTVTYAAPEQILGAAEIDHRADIYALGCMMFEFETGSPPFSGRTIAEIARHHIQTPPPKLGGWFKRTELGLEKVIATCLEKKPGARFSTYEELDTILVDIGRRHGIASDHCIATKRYERALLGEGHLKQDLVLGQAPVKGTDGYALVESDDISAFIEEAINLIELKRYREAELLLRPHFLPDLLKSDGDWTRDHSIALNYAYCLMRMGKHDDAMAILPRLDTIRDKPAEFYVNYSLCLLYLEKWEAAKIVCLRGLRHFPEDTGILGNQTVALLNSNDLDGAQESAIRRLQIRRDVHSIEEAVSVLQRQAKAKRDVDLPASIANAKKAGDLTKEGLALNPRFYALRLQEIRLRRIAYDEAKVLELYEAMTGEDECPAIYKQGAYIEMTEQLAEGKSFATALDLLKRSGDKLAKPLLALKMRILARHFMIGKENANGQRIVIPEVRDYFLALTPSHHFRDPVIAAEVQDWMGDAKCAIATLEHHLSNKPSDWDAIKLLAMIFLRQGDNRALEVAQLLVTKAPWRAESFDLLSYVATKTGRKEIAASAKKRGDEVFEKEDQLFTELRTYLDA